MKICKHLWFCAPTLLCTIKVYLQDKLYVPIQNHLIGCAGNIVDLVTQLHIMMVNIMMFTCGCKATYVLIHLVK